jgi:hypothetical protein
VAGCLDLDLNFSPSTNLLPIRRLELAIGLKAKVQASWLRFPSFTVEPLVQPYRRIHAATYRYESAGGRFVTELQVNTGGFVTSYRAADQEQDRRQTCLPEGLSAASACCEALRAEQQVDDNPQRVVPGAKRPEQPDVWQVRAST